MRIVIKTLITILFLTLSISYTYSQNNVNITKSDKQIFILGKKYYIHKVKRGQTLYSISNVYKAPIQEIISENSELLSGRLKSGMELKIPVLDYVSNTEENKIDNFIYHTVKPKQTLYFIKTKYHVSEADIIKNNPQINGGVIKVGEVLKIPRISNQSNSFESEYYFHEVKPSETLFSLSQRYNVDIESINRLNPETAQGNLKIGQVLRIPKHNFTVSETLTIDHSFNEDIKYFDYDPLYFEEEGTIPCNEFHYNRFIKFKVALMLPLFIEENNSISANSTRYYKGTEKFYELYQGFLIAIDKLKKSGVSVELFVYDTKKSINRVQNILSKPELKNIDLIIGPVYSENFKLAANFAQQHKINIVSPVPQSSNRLVETNPFIFMTNPSEDVKVENISKHLANAYDRSIIVIHNGTIQEEKVINLFKSKLVKTFASYQNIEEIVFKQVNYKFSGINGVMDALSIGLDNIVLIPSNDEAFITDIVTRLNFNKNHYKVTVYGMKSWESLRNIQIEYLANLNCHYGTTSYIDYNNKSIKNFMHKYESTYNIEPGLYSYLGYDISYYFINLMKKYGKHFQFCLPGDISMKKSGLMYSFNFQRVSPTSGFENNWFSIIKIDKNYKLVKVK